MATTNRTRVLQVNQVVLDQVEFLQTDLFTRVTGLTISNMALVLSYNNAPVNWPLVSGTGVTDTQIVSGNVYFSALASGAYSIRFLPNALGTWVVELAYSAGVPPQRVTTTYDIITPYNVEYGLSASFTP